MEGEVAEDGVQIGPVAHHQILHLHFALGGPPVVLLWYDSFSMQLMCVLRFLNAVYQSTLIHTHAHIPVRRPAGGHDGGRLLRHARILQHALHRAHVQLQLRVRPDGEDNGLCVSVWLMVCDVLLFRFGWRRSVGRGRNHTYIHIYPGVYIYLYISMYLREGQRVGQGQPRGGRVNAAGGRLYRLDWML